MPSPVCSLRRRHRAYKYGRDPEARRRPSLLRASSRKFCARDTLTCMQRFDHKVPAYIFKERCGSAIHVEPATKAKPQSLNPQTRTSASLQTFPITEVFTDTTCNQDGQVIHDSSSFTVCGPCLHIHLRNKINGSIRFSGDFLHDVLDVKLSHVCPYFRLFRKARPADVIVVLERALDG